MVRKRPFGPTREPVPVLGQGTWQVRDTKAAAAALEEGLRLGMTHIDTAELYEARGGSETMLGELLSRPSASGGAWRDHVFLASKVLPKHGDRKGVTSACKDSLVRLQTDRIDLYYHHWRQGTVPLEETLRAMADLVDHGWVRHVGVSNYDVEDLEEAEAILGKGRIAANQVLYHLEDRGAEAEVIPWCRAHGVAVVAYSPFGAGRFVALHRRAKLDDLAARLGRTPRQVALAFLARQEHVFPIPKAEQPSHVRDNAGGDFDLPADAVAELEALFPLRPGLRTA